MVHRTAPPRISLLASQAFGSPGGIQTYMRLILHALHPHAEGIKLLSLCDEAEDPALRAWRSRTGHRIYGSHGDKCHLIQQSLLHSRSDEVMLVGHLGLAPIAMALKALGRIRGYAVILHGVEAWRRLNALDRLALRLADRIIATTPFTQYKCSQVNGLDPAQTDVLPLAIEPNRFDRGTSTPRQRLVDEPLRILSVARLDAGERYKGIDHTIEAVADLASNDISVTYHIVGDGDDRPRLKTLANSLGASEQVHFLGRVSDQGLRREFERADVFALPSAGEGFGLVYLEAMHYGLPSIASPEGGAQHVVTDELDGLQVPYAQPEALAMALSRLRDPALYQALSRGALESAKGRFSFARFQDDLLSIMERV